MDLYLSQERDLHFTYFTFCPANWTRMYKLKVQPDVTIQQTLSKATNLKTFKSLETAESQVDQTLNCSRSRWGLL